MSEANSDCGSANGHTNDDKSVANTASVEPTTVQRRRLVNLLKRLSRNLKTLEDFLRSDDSVYRETHGFGRTTVRTICAYLRELGLGTDADTLEPPGNEIVDAVAEYCDYLWMKEHGEDISPPRLPDADRIRDTRNFVERLLNDLLSLKPPSDDAAHSTDFRSVLWYGATYSFTTNQTPVVKLLYENWKSRTPDVGDETLLRAVDRQAPPARLSTLFRDHPAWGKMIKPGGTKGTHRLAEPEEEKS